MLTREQLTREAASLRQSQARGYGLPSAKRLGDDLQRVIWRRMREHNWCESGCDAPAITQEPLPPLCRACAGRMLP